MSIIKTYKTFESREDYQNLHQIIKEVFIDLDYDVSNLIYIIYDDKNFRVDKNKILLTIIPELTFSPNRRYLDLCKLFPIISQKVDYLKSEEIKCKIRIFYNSTHGESLSIPRVITLTGSEDISEMDKRIKKCVEKIEVSFWR